RFDSREIVLQSSWIGQKVGRVVDEANQLVALRVTPVALLVLDELVSNVFLLERRAGHLRFDDDVLAFEQEVHSRGPACVARRPLFGTNILEMKAQNRVQRILHIVLVIELNGGTASVAGLKLDGELLKSLA